MIGTSLFNGVVDFTRGNVSNFIGATGASVNGSASITLTDANISPGLSVGMPVSTNPYGIVPDGTTVLSISGANIGLSNPVSATGNSVFYFGLTAGSYYLSNAKLIDINQLVTVNDIPDYEIGLSGGLGIKPFAVYAQALQTNNRVLKAIYLKYIVTKVLSRDATSSTFSAIISWGSSGTESESGTKFNTAIRVLPLVELSPAGLLPPIIDYRSYDYSRLPEGQPFNAEIINAIGGTGFVFPSDLPVSLSATKSFGRYVNGDVIPAQGKTPAEVIELALSESISPVVSLSTSTSVPLPFGITAVSNNINFSHTIRTLGANVSTAILEFRRGNGAWSTLSTSTASSGTYVHTNVNTLWDTTNYNYRYTVTDSAGASGFATLTISIAPYVSPTIPITVTGSSVTAPETNAKREIGNVSSVITSTITRNSPLADLLSYRILCQTNEAGAFNEIDSGALAADVDTITYTHNDTGLDTSSSLTYKIEVTDEYAVNNSANSKVSFQYLIFCGPVAVTPTNSAGVRALTTRYFADSTNNPFILNTGNVYNRFTAAMPNTKTISLVMDLEVNANLTPTYTSGLSTFNVNSYSGDAVSYKVYTMNPAIAYTFSHRHQITFTP